MVGFVGVLDFPGIMIHITGSRFLTFAFQNATGSSGCTRFAGIARWDYSRLGGSCFLPSVTPSW